MLSGQKFSNLRIYATLVSNQQISILERQNCLANFFASVYREGQIFSVLQQYLMTENGGKNISYNFPAPKYSFPYILYRSPLKICNFLSFKHSFAFLLNLFCFQCFPFVQSDKIASASFSNHLPKTEAKQKWLNGIKFTLNGCVCADRPRRVCHFRAEGAIFLLS